MLQRHFPAFTIGEDAYSEFNRICINLGKRFLIIGGETALSVCVNRLFKYLSNEFTVIDTVIYGKECFRERIYELYEQYKATDVDFIVGVGGGKALDTAKFVAKLMGVEIVTLPTIASTCAASSALSVIYTKEHAFEGFEYYKKPAYHCFIDTTIIANAPFEFLRAGVGDTLAKHYEVEFSARIKELDYSSALAITISKMCCEPLFKYAKKAISDCKKNQTSIESEHVILAIIITTGMVSMLINPDYNGAMAHALFYGLTNISGFEEKFLHGDVVGYCTAVQLAVDNNLPEAKRIKEFLKSIGIETTLKERNIKVDRDELDFVLNSAIQDPDMKVIPYEVTPDMLFKGIKIVEDL